jgi:hypothetical protein
MTPYILQKELAKEVEKICRHMELTDAKGQTASLKAYEQSLPLRADDEENEPYPHAIVRLDNGKAGVDKEDANKVNVLILIGVCDRNYEMQGHKQILNIINDIYERFAKNPVLSKQFIADKEIVWSLQDEDMKKTYPYFLGGMSMSFTISAFNREGSIYT